MFWKTNSNEEKMLPPKNIPEPVGRYLVVNLGKDPDWVWNLKAVMKAKGNEKDVFEIRVFDQSQVASQKIKVKDYNSFNDFPKLVLYEGWFNKKTFEVKVEARLQKEGSDLPSVA